MPGCHAGHGAFSLTSRAPWTGGASSNGSALLIPSEVHVRLLVIGATGRTGAGAIDAALAAGHDVTALVRNPAGYAAPERVTVAQGDVYAPATLDAAFAPGFDAVIVTVGANVFKPSTLVTDSARAVVAAARKAGVARYLGITGIAQLPATLPGKVAQFALASRRSSTRYAITKGPTTSSRRASSIGPWRPVLTSRTARPLDVTGSPRTAFPAGFTSSIRVTSGPSSSRRRSGTNFRARPSASGTNAPTRRAARRRASVRPCRRSRESSAGAPTSGRAGRVRSRRARAARRR